ncbi:peptidoglycan-binding protein [Streptomyces cyaneofuscatus]
MSESGSHRSQRSGRSRRTTVAVVSAAVLLGACGSVWWIAAQARTPEQRATNAAPPDASQITGTVSAEPLVERLELTGTVAAASRTTMTGTAPSGAVRAVVTELPVKTGDTVNVGDVVAEVSGRPVLVLPGRFPAYRDLRLGDKGPDVRQLQRALNGRYGVAVTGTYGTSTATAVKRLYEDSGYEAPVGEASDVGSTTGSPDSGGQSPDTTGRGGAQTDGGTGGDPDPSTGRPEPATGGGAGTGSVEATPGGLLLAAEVGYVGSLPAVVVEVGGQVGGPADRPLVVLGNGGQQISATLTADQRTQLRDLPDGAKIKFGEGPFSGHSGRLHALRAVTGGSDETAKGGSRDVAKDEVAQQIALFIPKGGPENAASGTAQQVTVELRSSPAGALQVPVSAVWTDLGGTSVVTVVRSKEKQDVPVEVVFTFDGLAAVTTEADALRSGDTVLLSRLGGQGADSAGGTDG